MTEPTLGEAVKRLTRFVWLFVRPAWQLLLPLLAIFVVITGAAYCWFETPLPFAAMAVFRAMLFGSLVGGGTGLLVYSSYKLFQLSSEWAQKCWEKSKPK